MAALTTDVDDLEEYFDYLDDLRASGETNMYGAGPYLMRDFDMPRSEAHQVLSAWMQTFSIDETAEMRARAALSTEAE